MNHPWDEMIEQSEDALLLAGPDGQVLLANPAARRLFRMPPDGDGDGSGAAFLDVAAPGLPAVAEGADRSGRFSGEATFRRADGTLFTARLSSVRFTGADGRPRLGMTLRDPAEGAGAGEGERGLPGGMLGDILEKAADGICVCHNVPEWPHVRFSHWNPRMTAITGYTVEEINRLGWYQSLYPDPQVQRRAVDRMARMRKGDDIRAEEWVIATKGGEERHLSMSTSVVRQEGETVHVLAVMRDVSEQKRTEEALRRSEHRFRTLIHAMREGLVEVDVAGRVTFVNDRLLEMAGRGRDELLGRRFDDLLQGGDPRREGLERFRCHEGAGCAHEGALTRPDGDTRQVLFSPNVLRDAQGRVAGGFGVLSDITDLKASAGRLKQSEERYRLLAENMADIVWILDRELNTVYASPSMEKVLGFTLEERKAQRLADTVTPESLERIAAQFAEELRRDAEPGADPDRRVRIEVEYYHRDGRTVWMENSVKALRNEAGEITGVYGASRDITERKRAQTALMDERGLFVAGPTMVFKWQARPGLPVEYASPNTREVLGVRAEDLMAGRAAYEALLHGQDLLRVRSELIRHAEAGDSRFEHAPYRLRKSDGSYAWVSQYTSVLRDAAGAVTHYLGYVLDISRQHHVEERLALAIEGTDAGLWDWHVQTGETVFDERWAGILGYTLDELEPVSIETWRRLCHPDDLARSERLLREHFAGASARYECECRMRHKDGSWVWVLDRGKVFQRDDGGRPVRMAGTHVDITQRKNAEAVTRAERDLGAAWSSGATLEDRLRTCLLTAMQVSSMECGGIYLVDDADGSLALAVHQGLPEAFIRKTGRYAADSENARIVREGAPVYTDRPDARFLPGSATVQEGLRSAAVVPVLFQGRAVACLNVASYSAYRIPETNRIALESIARYAGSFIAQEMQEERIREGWRDLDTLFQSIEDMLLVVDRHGTILDCNHVVSEKLEFLPGELLGKPVRWLHPPERAAEADAVMADVLAQRTNTCRIPLRTRSGGTVPVETKIQAGHWKGCEVFFGISRDMTDRDRLEAERIAAETRRQQMEKVESLSRMAGAVAHHFNNMLSAVLGNLELARQETGAGAVLARSLAEADRAARRAADMSRLMLTLLGRQPAAVKPMDLCEACLAFLEASRGDVPAGVEVRTELPRPGPLVLADPDPFGQVLAHLLANAREAMPGPGGVVRVAVSRVEPADVPDVHRFPLEWSPSAGGYACLSVADTGRGMDPSVLSRIFDPFYSDKFAGRGLGLAVALGIVRSMDGCIAVESQPGRGATFRVFLPMAPGADPPGAPGGAPGPRTRRGA